MKIPRPILKKEILLGRFSIPFRVYGDQGQTIVCLNGAQQSMAMWHSFITHFSDHYKIILFDFPSRGKARFLAEPKTLSLDDEIGILKGVLTAVQPDSDVILCTASWGGVIALAFAVRYPENVKRLVLGSIGTKPNKRMVETIQRGIATHTSNRSEMAEILIESFGQNLPQKIKDMIMAQFRSMSEESIKAFSEHGLFVLSAQNLTDLVDLKSVKAETVIFRGEHDTIIDSEDVDFLASQIPHCIAKTVSNVGHFMHLETDDIFGVYHEAFEGKFFETALEESKT